MSTGQLGIRDDEKQLKGKKKFITRHFDKLNQQHCVYIVPQVNELK